jgi:hypothetical protein
VSYWAADRPVIVYNITDNRFVHALHKQSVTLLRLYWRNRLTAQTPTAAELFEKFYAIHGIRWLKLSLTGPCPETHDGVRCAPTFLNSTLTVYDTKYTNGSWWYEHW